MTNKKQAADEIAALRAEVETLKAAQPKPIDWAEQDRAAAKFRDEMHQMREGRMSLATPPSVVRDFAVLDDATVKGIALRDAYAPTGPSRQVSNVRGAGGVPGGGTGWAREIPLGPSMHQRYVDAQLDAQDAKDRAELIERNAKLKATEKGKP